MSKSTKPAQMTLRIDAGEDADADELDQLTRQLMAELQQMEVESVELVRVESPPEGTKTAEVVTLGALAVAVLPTVVPKLIDFLQAWMLRGEDRMVKIKTQVEDRSLEIEFSPKSTSPKELKSLLDAMAMTVADDDISD